MPRLILTPAQRAERKFWSGLRSALRRLWLWYSPARKAVWAAAKTEKGWKCAVCGGVFKGKNCAVDHIVPCGTLKCIEDVGPFIGRLMVSAWGLQVICKTCHDAKSKAERGLK